MSGITELYQQVKELAPKGTNIDAELKKLVNDGSYTERGALNHLKDKFAVRKEGKKDIGGYWLGGTAGNQQGCYWILTPDGVETIFVRGSNREMPKIAKFTPVTVKTEMELNVVQQTSSLSAKGPADVSRSDTTIDPAQLLSSFSSLDGLKEINRKQVISEGYCVGLGTPRWQNNKKLDQPLPLMNEDGSLNLQIVVAAKPGEPGTTASVKVKNPQNLKSIIPLKNFDLELKQKGMDWLANQMRGEHLIFFGFCMTKTPAGAAMNRPSVSIGRTGFLALYDNLYKELQSGSGVGSVPESMPHNKFTNRIKMKLKKLGKLDRKTILKIAKHYHVRKADANGLLSQIVDGKTIKVEKGCLIQVKKKAKK